MSLIAGFHSGHDCSFCILKDGKPIIHAELERYIRLKEPLGDSLDFLFKEFKDADKITHFTTGLDSGTNVIGAGDTVQLSVQCADTGGDGNPTANTTYYITCLWEWNLT